MSFRALARALGLAIFFAGPAQAAGTPFETEGWSTWRVAAVDQAPDWCCHQWNAGQGKRVACDLDRGLKQRNHWNDGTIAGDEMQIYALVQDGELRRLAALDPSCPVTGEAPLVDLGLVDSAESLAWMKRIDDSDHRLDNDLLSIVAIHDGAEAPRELERIARSDQSVERRKRAVFWMGQLRVTDTRDTLLAVMREDPDQEVRNHAIFSWSQSTAEDRVDVLIDVIEDRQQPFEDRKKALFWLAQVGNGEGVDYIQQLLR